jgi:hypothetical protein
MLDKISGRYGSHVRHEINPHKYVAIGTVFGRDTVMFERINMELNFSCLYVSECYWITSEFCTVAGIREDDSFTAINLLSCYINVL